MKKKQNKKVGCDICGEPNEITSVRFGQSNWSKVYVCRKCSRKNK